MEAQYLVEAQADAQLRDYLRRRRAREEWLAEARRAAEEALERRRRELWRERREKCRKVSLWVSYRVTHQDGKNPLLNLF